MNKHQKALNKIVENCCPNCHDDKGCSSCSIEKICNCTAKDWVNTLQELVDKSTPKMFKIKTDTDGRMIYVCPNCGNILVKFWSEVETITMYNYCDNCGQALKYME